MQRELTNTEKVAVTLLGLGKELASAILQHLTESEVKRISRAFMSVSEMDRVSQLSVAKEFLGMIRGGDSLFVDGKQFAKDVIANAFGESAKDGILDYVSASPSESIAALIQEVPEKILGDFISGEHPQTVAFLMCKMNPAQAALILPTMPESNQTDVLLRIASINNVKAEIIDEVRGVLRAQLENDSSNSDEEIAGVKSAANILNYFERNNEERIVTEIEEMYPEMAEQIRNLMFTFEDIKKIDDKGIQTVLKEIPRDQLVLSLKTASPGLKDKIFGNVSQRAAAMIQEDLEGMGQVKRKDVEKAQQGVVDIVRRLEAEGKIVTNGGGAEDALV